MASFTAGSYDGPRADPVATPRKPEAREHRQMLRDRDKMILILLQQRDRTRKEIAAMFRLSRAAITKIEDRWYAAERAAGRPIPTRRWYRPDVSVRKGVPLGPSPDV